MIKKLKLTKRRKLLAAVIICVALITGSTMLWQMGQVAEAAILDPHPGLVGWWRFDEGTGSFANDSSGNGNSGNVNNALWVNGKYGNALQFNGTALSYLEVPDAPSLRGFSAFTILYWVNIPLGLESEADTWFFKVGKAADWREWNLGWQGWSDSFTLSFNNETGTSQRYDGPPNYYLTANQWYHVVGTYDGTYLRIYINGVELGSGANVGSHTTQILNDPVRITSGAADSGKSFTIDEIRIYNRALSSAEIQADFQSGPDFSSQILAKIAKGTTQIITTLSWQGTGSVNATITSPSQTFTEGTTPVYQKTSYSTTEGTASILNIKRLSISVSALSSDQTWTIALTFENTFAYQISVEVQK